MVHVIENGNVVEYPDECTHDPYSEWRCISCELDFCNECDSGFKDDSGEKFCTSCKEKHLSECERCAVLYDSANTGKNGLCQICADEMGCP